jgi:kynurenine formamidase
LVEHTGTHMDAPLHFTADGHSVDEIPVTDFVVPLAVVDISQRAQDNPDTALTPDDIRSWEAANGPYAWLGSGRWGVEAVANLDVVPPKGAILVLGGPKVRGGTGGASRVIALV